MNRLEIKNLTQVYDNGVVALDRFSLTLENGMFGLLGPNGAGKSTLMRLLATLQTPSEGRITFNGQDILQNPKSIRRHLGYLPQEFDVYPGMSAVQLLDHLALLKGLTSKQGRKEQVEALLQLTNLYAHRHQAVSSYSGGMRQRFGIAQALLGNPKLIIVDEPTAGLDPEERNRFHNLLSEIGESVIVILSTHIVEDVSDLCPAMGILSGGKLIRQGSPNELMKELKGKIWRKIIRKSDLKLYEQDFQLISQRLKAGRLQVHVWAESQPATGFEAVNPDLEDVYFSALSGFLPSASPEAV